MMVTMDNDLDGKGAGEAAARARSCRMLVNFGVLAAVGFVVGLSAAMVEAKDAPLSAGGTLPAWFAIVAAVVALVAVTIGSLRYHRSMDELQHMDNLWAGTLGANMFLGAYPIWLILWKGGLLPAPDALILYLLVFATTALAFAWRKLR